jgi:hypothetical protein
MGPEAVAWKSARAVRTPGLFLWQPSRVHANLQPYQRENPTPSRLAYPATKGGEILDHLGGTT